VTRLPERNLDVLRTIAVSCVLFDHVFDPLTRQIGFMPLWRLGRVGVLLFFVHTSLVLMASLERLGTSGNSTWKWTRAFYIRRAFRIYPLAIATILALLVFHIPAFFVNRGAYPPYIPPSTKVIVTNVALAQNLFYQPDLMGPLWSLPVEVQMYVVLPLLYLLARRSWPALLTALGVAIVLGLAVQFSSLPLIGRFTMFVFAPCFVSGVIAYRFCLTRTTRHGTPLRAARRIILPAWTWPLAIAVAIVVFVLCQATPWHLERTWPFCLLLGVFIPSIAELPESWITRSAATVAKYSYGIYLCHVPLLWFCTIKLYGQPFVIQALVFATLLVLVPFAAYHLIESPAIKLGVKLAHGSMRGTKSPINVSTAPAP